MPVFSESTLIPISFLLTVGGSFVGFVAWLTKLHWDVTALKQKLDRKDETIKELRAEISSSTERGRQDSERLVRLETQITGLYNEIKELKELVKENHQR